MNQPATLTLKIINDGTVLDRLPKENPIPESTQAFIKSIVRLAVQEYVKEVGLKESYQFPSGDRILRLPEVVTRVGLKRASIYRYIKDGNFPKSLNLGARSVGWKESQIAAWLEERANNLSAR